MGPHGEGRQQSKACRCPAAATSHGAKGAEAPRLACLPVLLWWVGRAWGASPTRNKNQLGGPGFRAQKDLSGWRDDENVVHSHSGMLFILEKETYSNTCYYREEPRGPYAE